MSERVSKKFVLKWRIFERGLPFMFYKNEFRADVKLRTNDGHEMGAHTIPLVASSKYFTTILAGLPREGIKELDVEVRMRVLEYILNFVYEGEVRVPVDDVLEFFEAARLLQMNGLVE